MMRFAVAGLVFVIVLSAGGFVVLATSPLTPAVQKVELAVPDDQLPR